MNSPFPTAGIRITIINFVPTAVAPLATQSFDGYTKADTLLISSADGTVSQSAVNEPIRVDRGAKVDLVFEVVAGDGTGHSYQPVGISFLGQSGIGLDDFPTRMVSADPFKTLRLTVHDANLGGNSFNFKLVIQREDGALGVIDPQVDNA